MKEQFEKEKIPNLTSNLTREEKPSILLTLEQLN
jgi:hypothetical protein